MEKTGGEPDVVGHDKKTSEYIFYDCSAESPKGRRSVCYDREALESRKEYKPEDNAIDMAAAMGIELLTEEQYRELQKLGDFDTKTSSWVKTPSDIRKLGGALFCDRRYDTVFVYHNGAESIVFQIAMGGRVALLLSFENSRCQPLIGAFGSGMFSSLCNWRHRHTEIRPRLWINVVR